MSQDSSSSSKPEKASSTRVDPEVKAKPERRQFSAEYKRRILEEADVCTEAGQIGALLRRKGLYSSNLTHWYQQMSKGALGHYQGRSSQGVKMLLPHIGSFE